MEVSQETKNAYKKDKSRKDLKIYFPELDLTIKGGKIYEESMELIEKIFDGDSIEFVGCNASLFSVQIYGLTEEVKGKRIEAYISADGTEEISLFKGVVDSAKSQSDKSYKKLTAYDDLYQKGNIDVAGWYNNLSLPNKLSYIRNSLFAYLGIEQLAADLPNDNIVIKRMYDPKQLKALNVITAVCQINGAFGIINRQGKFEYLYLKQTQDTEVYPSYKLLPSKNLFPTTDKTTGVPEEKEEAVGHYRKVDYEEYQVKPVDRLTIRNSEEEQGVSFGTGDNNYIIQGNMFTYGKTDSELRQMAEAIYPHITGIFYYPFQSVNTGLPYIECGNIVTYQTKKGISRFYVFKRRIKGIQSLTDSYGAGGEEYQTEFITDLQVQIDVIKQNISDAVKKEVSNYSYSKNQIDDALNNLETLRVLSVPELPEDPDPNTIYLIQGEVTVN